MTITATPAPSEAPPVSRIGPLNWMQQNLFSSIPNTLLTLAVGYILYAMVRGVLNFLATADFTVVTSNLTLFAIGQYPRDQAWRVLASLGVVVVLGLGSAVFGRNRSGFIKRALWVGWLLSFPIIWLILAGVEGSEALPQVRTQLWSGLLLTVMLTFVGIVFSFPIGILLALGRRSDLPIIRLLSTAYIEVIRGVPLISILFMAQILLPLFIGVDISAVIRAMAGITLFSAAYIAEIVRGGLQAVPRGQVEAAQALGFSAPLVTGLIVLPQALRFVIPAIVGQFISLFKDTSLVSIITLLDLLGITEAAMAQSPEFGNHKIEAYLFVGAIYFIVSYVISSVARRIEKRTSRMGGTHSL